MPASDRHPNAGKPWTPEESETLRDLAGANAHPRLIATRLGRSLASVSAQAERLGIGLGGSSVARRGEQQEARRRLASGEAEDQVPG